MGCEGMKGKCINCKHSKQVSTTHKGIITLTWLRCMKKDIPVRPNFGCLKWREKEGEA